ncbi:hypothetical protein [Altererythrobacter sp. BO-6]|uniref:hypothetical protein n=1 Tax=Altererythrobacter sp. BO-6 TaxID=2604537 RepID=UPI001F49F352|nr:hypothetical protein [Altererythrobacter sp. BO-6]
MGLYLRRCGFQHGAHIDRILERPRLQRGKHQRAARDILQRARQLRQRLLLLGQPRIKHAALVGDEDVARLRRQDIGLGLLDPRGQCCCFARAPARRCTRLLSFALEPLGPLCRVQRSAFGAVYRFARSRGIAQCRNRRQRKRASRPAKRQQSQQGSTQEQ